MFHALPFSLLEDFKRQHSLSFFSSLIKYLCTQTEVHFSHTLVLKTSTIRYLVIFNYSLCLMSLISVFILINLEQCKYTRTWFKYKKIRRVTRTQAFCFLTTVEMILCNETELNSNSVLVGRFSIENLKEKSLYDLLYE